MMKTFNRWMLSCRDEDFDANAAKITAGVARILEALLAGYVPDTVGAQPVGSALSGGGGGSGTSRQHDSPCSQERGHERHLHGDAGQPPPNGGDGGGSRVGCLGLAGDRQLHGREPSGRLPYKGLVVPGDGFGTGRARLQTDAPRTFAFLQRQVRSCAFGPGLGFRVSRTWCVFSLLTTEEPGATRVRGCAPTRRAPTPPCREKARSSVSRFGRAGLHDVEDPEAACACIRCPNGTRGFCLPGSAFENSPRWCTGATAIRDCMHGLRGLRVAQTALVRWLMANCLCFALQVNHLLELLRKGSSAEIDW